MWHRIVSLRLCTLRCFGIEKCLASSIASNQTNISTSYGVNQAYAVVLSNSKD